METKRVLDKTGPSLSRQRDSIIFTIKIQNFIRWVAYEQRQLVLHSPTIMAASDVDVRACIRIDVGQIEEELQHSPIIEIEMEFERGPA